MIEVWDIYKSFGKVEALNGVTTTINKAEVVVIIGPSGSGKATFLRCLNHLETIDRGTIMIDGIPLLRKGEAARLESYFRARREDV